MTDLHDDPHANAWPPAYYPPQTRATLPSGAESHIGITYAIIPGHRHLQLDLHVPAARRGPVPLVVWIHGGGWAFGARDLVPSVWPAGIVFQAAIGAGLAVATIDYRHSREAAFPAQLHDAKAAVRYLRSFGPGLGVDPDRIGVWGESAGGHLAALVALLRDPELEGEVGVVGPSSEVSAAVCYYPVTDVSAMAPPGGPGHIDLVEVLLRNSPHPRQEALRLFSPVTHVRADAPPFLLVHGEEDKHVSIDQSERLAAALRGAGAEAELVRVPGADHIFIGADPVPLIDQSVRYLRTRLGA